MNFEQDEITTILTRGFEGEKTIIGDDKFQSKLIKLIIEDSYKFNEGFSEQIVDIIKPIYFDNLNYKLIVEIILKHVEKYSKIPQFDIIKNIIRNDYQGQEITQKTLFECVDLLVELEVIHDKEYIKDESLSFCRKQSLKQGLIKCADAWHKEKYDTISGIISDSLKAGEPKSSGHDYLKELEKRLIVEHRNPVTAMPGLDVYIGGGLAGGELGIVMSPTGGGKSMMLVKFASSALLAGKNVLYYTLELQEKVIGNRIDSCLFGLELKYLNQFVDIIKSGIEEISKKGGRLFIKEFPTGAASVHTFKSHLASLEREHGFIPDVIMVDYADIMKPIGSHQEKRHALTSVYEGLRGFSMELGIPIWTASQSSRDSINETSFDLRSISESLGKAQTADLIIGIARDGTMKKERRANMMILKNRLGDDGQSFNMRFDTSRIDIKMEEDSVDNMGRVNIGSESVSGINMEGVVQAKRN